MTPAVRQSLQQGITAHNKGNFREAERLYRAVLKLHPKNPDANHNLGLLAVAANKSALALPLFKIALDANRNEEKFWLSYIKGLIKERHFEKAKKFIRQANKHGVSKNNFQEVYNSFGVALKASGKLIEAEASFRKAISLAPGFHVPYINLGNTLQELGKLEASQESFKQALDLKPDFAETYFNLANTLQMMGKFQEAAVSYGQAIALDPKHFVAHNNFGLALSKIDRLEEAETHYIKAISLNADYFEAYLNIGNVRFSMGKLEEAEANFREAIVIKPDYAESYLNLCELLEKTNRLDEVLSVVENGRDKASGRQHDFSLVEAFIFFRQEKFELVGDIISNINPSELSTKRKVIFLKFKADWLNHQKDFDGAFKTFGLMNKTVKSSCEYQVCQPDQYFDIQKEKVRQIEHLQKVSDYKSTVLAEGLQPAFMIGFPRSGTTLLDTILRSHSKIEVVEEQLLVIKMFETLGLSKTISNIEDIDDNLAKTLRKVYFRELAKHVQIQEGMLLVDKLPLNILDTPLIKQVFPEAKFILALRHPLDCVLSCWMQNFKLNPSMANMVDLDRTADFYNISMDMLKLCEQRYLLNVHAIRYEDLVSDFDGSVLNLLNFLKLSWEEQLKGYQKTALAREKINTPSYSQVVKPIYNSATYRWKKYEQYLIPQKLKLARWIEEYGYSD